MALRVGLIGSSHVRRCPEELFRSSGVHLTKLTNRRDSTRMLKLLEDREIMDRLEQDCAGQDVIVICGGGNDLSYHCVDDVLYGLLAMHQRFERRDRMVLIMPILQRRETRLLEPPDYKNMSESLNRRLRRSFSDHWYHPVLPELRNLELRWDGVHLTASDYKVWVRALIVKLKKLYPARMNLIIPSW